VRSRTEKGQGRRGQRAQPQRPRPRRRRQTQAERRAQTRARLLKAAGTVFARHGYERATLDEVARQAGVSKGAVYYNFASKEELFLALLEERLVARLGDVERAFDEAGPPPRASAAAADRFLAGLERNPRWPPLFLEFVSYCARDPARRIHFAERFLRSARRILARLIAERYDELGVDPPLAASELAICVDALTNGMLIERLFDPDSVPPDLLGKAIALLTRP
jgi:AcrR family transcriptional regulator